MIVLCYLSPQSLGQVNRAFPPPHRVATAATWNELVADLQARRCDVAIVDPCVGGDHLAPMRLAALSGSASAPVVPVVGYLSVSAASMRAVQALARLGASEIVIRGVDDSTDMLASIVRRALAAWSANGVVAAMATPCDSLPAAIASAIRQAFDRPDQVRSVSDLAGAARTTRRSLDRWLARTGLSSARTLLSCARVNAAFHLLSDGKLSAAQVASMVGYASVRSLSREMCAIAGHPASSIRRQLSQGELVGAIEHRLVRRLDASSSRPSY